MTADFSSDNASGIHPAILQAIADANAGAVAAYGNDAITERAVARVREVFECPEAAVLFVATGTAANALSLAVTTPPWGVVYGHAWAHIDSDECAAPEFYTGGAKIRHVADTCGKLDPGALDSDLLLAQAGVVHHAQPAVVSLTQATEWGTVYAVEEVAALTQVARKHGLAVHMDGARFANAVAHLGCAPADITWRAGVDVLCLGATKNGALAAEAIVLFDPAKAAELGFRRKRAGHLLSKMRFVSAQIDAYLTDGLWLETAGHANRLAGRLAEGLATLPGCALVTAPQANEVFARLPQAMADRLMAQGYTFYPWEAAGADAYRFVAGFTATEAEVDGLLDAARTYALDAQQAV